MKLMVQSYNNGGSTYNAEAEETAFLHYELDHQLDAPAQATIWLSDPTGSIAQKYNDDANDVYIIAGKATIEDPTGTDIFYGRIVKAEPFTDGKQQYCVLTCLDWMCQLDDLHKTYDMREDLDGSGLRQSTAHADIGSAVDEGAVYTSGGNYYLFDDAMAWDNDEWNGMYLIFPNSMAGEITVATGPYDHSVEVGALDTDTPANAEGNIWVNDTNNHDMEDNDEADRFVIHYKFKLWINESARYVAGSMTDWRLYLTYSLDGYDGGASGYHNSVLAVGTSNYLLGDYQSLNTDGEIHEITYKLPIANLEDIMDANGECEIRFDISVDAPNNTVFKVYYLMMEADVTTTGYSSAISITDTFTTNRIKVGTDLYHSAGIGIWEGCPYCIAQKIYNHINGLVTAADPQVTLTTSVESTSGITDRQYEEKTTLEILRDLARRDKAHFYIVLSDTTTPTVVWKSTFNNGAPETLSDTYVNEWQMSQDGAQVYNVYHVYGMRIGDEQLYTDSTQITGGDPGDDSQAKYNMAGAGRSAVLREAGIVSEYDTEQRATALVERDEDVQKMLVARIRGNTATTAHAKTLVLADEVSITSSHLGLSAQQSDVYIVSRFQYSSKTHMTTLTLHPRVSQQGLQPFMTPEQRYHQLTTNQRKFTSEQYVPKPYTNEVT